MLNNHLFIWLSHQVLNYRQARTTCSHLGAIFTSPTLCLYHNMSLCGPGIPAATAHTLHEDLVNPSCFSSVTGDPANSSRLFTVPGDPVNSTSLYGPGKPAATVSTLFLRILITPLVCSLSSSSKYHLSCAHLAPSLQSHYAD